MFFAYYFLFSFLVLKAQSKSASSLTQLEDIIKSLETASDEYNKKQKEFMAWRTAMEETLRTAKSEADALKEKLENFKSCEESVNKLESRTEKAVNAIEGLKETQKGQTKDEAKSIENDRVLMDQIVLLTDRLEHAAADNEKTILELKALQDAWNEWTLENMFYNTLRKLRLFSGRLALWVYETAMNFWQFMKTVEWKKRWEEAVVLGKHWAVVAGDVAQRFWADVVKYSGQGWRGLNKFLDSNKPFNALAKSLDPHFAKVENAMPSYLQAYGTAKERFRFCFLLFSSIMALTMTYILYSIFCCCCCGKKKKTKSAKKKTTSAKKKKTKS